MHRPHRVSSRIAGRAIVIALVALAALLGGLIVAGGLLRDTTEFRAASIYPQPREIRPFELVDADGNTFSAADLEGNLTLLFFGFTNCPDVCPDTLSVLARAMDKLENMRIEELPEVVFVSVDPERDTRDTMRDYVAYFDPEFRAVTGDDRALKALTSQVGALYVRGEPDDDGYYPVDHSGMVVLIDSEGRMIGRFPPATDAESMAADLFRLSRSGA